MPDDAQQPPSHEPVKTSEETFREEVKGTPPNANGAGEEYLGVGGDLGGRLIYEFAAGTKKLTGEPPLEPRPRPTPPAEDSESVADTNEDGTWDVDRLPENVTTTPVTHEAAVPGHGGGAPAPEEPWSVPTLPENVTNPSAQIDTPPATPPATPIVGDPTGGVGLPKIVPAVAIAVILLVVTLVVLASRGGSTAPANGSGDGSFISVVSSMTFIDHHVAGAPPCQGNIVHITIDVTGTPSGTPVVVAFTGAGLPAQDTFQSGTTYTRDVPSSGPGTWTSQVTSIGGKAPPSYLNTLRSSSC